MHLSVVDLCFLPSPFTCRFASGCPAQSCLNRTEQCSDTTTTAGALGTLHVVPVAVPIIINEPTPANSFVLLYILAERLIADSCQLFCFIVYFDRWTYV